MVQRRKTRQIRLGKVRVGGDAPVNGPGEARGADIGVAGGKGIGLISKKGEVIRKVPEAQIAQALTEEVEKFVAEREAEREEPKGARSEVGSSSHSR